MQQTMIGTKLILATAMTRQAYNDYRGWKLSMDEKGADAGFLVEYTDGSGGNHPDHKGYISWSPEDVFQKAYRPATGMTFGMAIEALRIGERVARSGWNGKGMWIALTPASSFAAPMAKPGHAARHLANDLSEAGSPNAAINLTAHIDMKAADGSLVVGWLASQTDMLAEDWQIVTHAVA